MLLIYTDPEALASALQREGYKIERTSLDVGDFSMEVLTWRPPATPELQQLLERAAVIAAREDSKASAHIRRALEACMGKATAPTGSEVKRAVLENPHLTDEQKARLEACDRAATQDKTRDP